ncbi:MAG TPA: hypothetical protein VFV31_13010 [Chitinophagaceae bacterium]|nr:hypothetical protein [Chitinophagaceae bacterium]
MYDNTNTGVLFTNDQKGNEKAPQYKGKINIGGKDYDLAGWEKQGKNGTFLSLKVSEPYNKEKGNQQVNQQAKKIADDLPF